MTDVVLNQWVPGGVMKQLGDAAGGVVYDQYAPGGCYRQLYAAAGVVDPPSQYAPGGPLGQVEAVLEAPAGGGAPDWVPANAVIHIDLVGGTPQGRAWVAGTGEVAVDTLLGSDVNTENAWGPSLYDGSKLQADGYVTDGHNSPAFIGAALSMILNAATVMIRTKHLVGDIGFSPLVIMSADGNDAIELDLQNNGEVVGSSYGGSFGVSIAGVVNVGQHGVNCSAITLTSARFDVAVNGSDAVAEVLASDDRPTGNPFIAATVDPNANNAIKSITFYDSFSSTAGLSELSDTGISNTAPTGIDIGWIDYAGQPGNGVYTTDIFAYSHSEFAVPKAIDPQGNFCTLTLVNNAGGKVFFGNPADGGQASHLELSQDNPAFTGAVVFILRATDPGGLYVEQEFTITVTA